MKKLFFILILIVLTSFIIGCGQTVSESLTTTTSTTTTSISTTSTTTTTLFSTTTTVNTSTSTSTTTSTTNISISTSTTSSTSTTITTLPTTTTTIVSTTTTTTTSTTTTSIITTTTTSTTTTTIIVEPLPSHILYPCLVATAHPTYGYPIIKVSFAVYSGEPQAYLYQIIRTDYGIRHTVYASGLPNPGSLTDINFNDSAIVGGQSYTYTVISCNHGTGCIEDVVGTITALE